MSEEHLSSKLKLFKWGFLTNHVERIKILLVALILLSLILLGTLFFLTDTSCWRSAAISALISWGVLLTALTEFLNIFSLINRIGISIGWLAIDLILITVLIVKHGAKRIINTIHKSSSHLWFSGHNEGVVALYLPPRYVLKKTRNTPDQILNNLRFNPFLFFSLASLSSILILTALVAWVAPPTTHDVLTYHLARVGFWLQNHSINHYPTDNLRQIDLPPWSSFTMLHLQALSGGDRLAHFVQWTSMIGSLVAVSLIAKELGANFYGQILSSAVCLSIPMGLLQSVTAQNDYVVSFWLVCLAYKSLLLLKGAATPRNGLEFGASLGLAMLTKPTAYIYAFPFCIIWLFSILKGPKKTFFRITLLSFFPALALNFSHWWRNFQAFSTPLGIAGESTRNQLFTPAAVISNLLRNILLHLLIPYQPFNEFFKGIVVFIHEKILLLDIDDPRTSFPTRYTLLKLPIQPDADSTWNPIYLEENFSGNFPHLILIVVAIALYLKVKTSRSYYRTAYLMALLATVLLFCTLLAWQPWGTRLHLPFFVMASPWIGAVLSSAWNRPWIAYFLIFILTLSALPCCIFSYTRPLAKSSYFTLYPTTIFEESRFDQYFRGRPATGPIKEAMDRVLQVGCYDIGLYADSQSRDYLFMAIAQHKVPEETVRFRSVHVDNPSQSIPLNPQQDFSPCAIIRHARPKLGQQIWLGHTSKLEETPRKDELSYIYVLETGKRGWLGLYLREDFVPKSELKSLLEKS